MKDIYDEALEIIKEAKLHNIYQDYFGCVQFEKALERAKKVEELLGLYQAWVDDTKNDLWEVICQKEKELEKLK